MKQSTEKLHSPMSAPQPDKSRKLLLSLSLAVIAALLLGTVSYAWLFGGADIITVNVDTSGVRVSAALYHIVSTNPNTDISANDSSGLYVNQAIDELFDANDIGGEGLGEFRGGSSLAFKMVIENISQDDTAVGENAEIHLSFNDLNAYFDEAVAIHFAHEANYAGEINSLLRDNSGVMMMKLGYIKYTITNAAGVVGELQTYAFDATTNPPTIADVPIVSYCGDGNDFFVSPTSIAPNEKLTVYFSIVCMTPTESAAVYTVYRNAKYLALPANTAEEIAFRDSYKAITDGELASLVIEKREESDESEGGGGQTTNSLAFNIRYIDVYAKATGNG